MAGSGQRDSGERTRLQRTGLLWLTAAQTSIPMEQKAVKRKACTATLSTTPNERASLRLIARLRKRKTEVMKAAER